MYNCKSFSHAKLNSITVAKRGGGRVSAWGILHMAAALTGCRMALVFSDCKDEDNTLKPYLKTVGACENSFA